MTDEARMADDGCTTEPDDGYIAPLKRRIRIVSDGTRMRTDVRDADTGELIHGVTALRFDLDASRQDFAICQLDVISEMDIVVDAEVRHFRLNRVRGTYEIDTDQDSMQQIAPPPD